MCSDKPVGRWWTQGANSISRPLTAEAGCIVIGQVTNKVMA